MAVLIFPLFMTAVAVFGLTIGLYRHGAFVEALRIRRARQTNLEMARSTARGLKGLAEVLITAVVCHGTTVLIGYRRASPASREASYADIETFESLSAHESPDGTMVAWLKRSDLILLNTLEEWCHMKCPVYLKIDPDGNLVTISRLESHQVVELCLTPAE